MKLSRRVRYALRLMIDIARHGEDERPVNLSQIARSSQMPHRYLEQLVMPLRKASLVKATIGRGGGYSLGQPAGSIKIGQIVEAMTGPIQIVECIGDPQTCALIDDCQCHLLYSVINRRISQVLDDYSLADLLDASWPDRVHEEGLV